jgi:hypothetical protein
MNRIVTVSMVLAGSPGGLTHVNPVGRLVTSALESVLLHKGFQQVNGMVVASLPVRINPVRHLRKNMGGQVADPNPRQNQKATIVSNERQTPSPLLG